MKYKNLGDTNIKVSLICLGTMTWGKQNNQKEAFYQIDYAIDQGVNFLDTAEMYAVPATKETYGTTEIIIGNWFKERNNREKVVIATKISGPGLNWIRGGGRQYTDKNISKAIENSLKRLNTDYIDLYQLHWPERKTNFFGKLDYTHNDKENDWSDFESILEVLKKYIDKGQIRTIGLSNETSWGMFKFLELSKLYNLPKIVSVQNPYNLLNRTYEIGMAEISIREKTGLLAYSPLASGVLSGKYRNGAKPKDSRLDLFGKYFPRYVNDSSFLAVEDYFKIAKKYNMSLSQLSLSFVNSQSFLTSNIVGATNMIQLKEDVESINVDLPQEILKEINVIHKKRPNPSP